MKAIASSATRPSTTIQIQVLFEAVLSLVVWLGRDVCVVVVVVVVVLELPLVCGDPELVVFWANAGTDNPTQAKLSVSRHTLIILDS